MNRRFSPARALVLLPLLISTVMAHAAAPASAPSSQTASSTYQLGTVESTAASNSQTGAKPAQSVNVSATQSEETATRTQVKATQPTSDFLHVIQNMPNVYVFGNGANGMTGSQIYLNGFSEKRLNFTLDGIPLNDSDSYSFYSNEWAPNNGISHVSVHPGAGSASTVGLSAFGGSVGIGTDEPGPYFYIQPTIGGGQYDTYERDLKINSGLFATGSIPTSLYALTNYSYSDGYFYNTYTSKSQQMFKSKSLVGPGALTLFFSKNNQFQNYYGGCTAGDIAALGNRCNRYNNDPSSTDYSGYNYNYYKNWITYVGYKAPLPGSGEISNKYYYYYGNGYGAGAYHPYGGSLQTQKGWNRTHRYGDVLRSKIPLGSALLLKPGVWFQFNGTVHYEARYNATTQAELYRVYDETVRTRTLEPYFSVEWMPTRSLKVTPGVKYLDVQRKYTDNSANASQNVTFTGLLPSLGVNYALTPHWHLYGNYTRNMRPPGYNQFYTGQFNQDLVPEKTNSYQLGTYFNTGAWSGRVTAFDTQYQNYILEVRQQMGSQTVNYLFNAGSATYRGASATLTYKITPALSMFANAGVLHTNIEYYDEPQPYAANQTQALGFNWDEGPWSASLSAKHVGTRYVIIRDIYSHDVSYYKLPSRVTADVSVSYKVALAPSSKGGAAAKDIEIGLHVSNLFDQQVPTDAAEGPHYSVSNPYLYLSYPVTTYLTITGRF